MLQLTPQQANELLNIINRNQAMVIGREFGIEFLTDYDKQLLQDYGIDLTELYSESGDTIFTSFHFGMLADSLEALSKINQITYNDLHSQL